MHPNIIETYYCFSFQHKFMCDVIYNILYNSWTFISHSHNASSAIRRKWRLNFKALNTHHTFIWYVSNSARWILQIGHFIQRNDMLSIYYILTIHKENIIFNTKYSNLDYVVANISDHTPYITQRQTLPYIYTHTILFLAELDNYCGIIKRYKVIKNRLNSQSSASRCCPPNLSFSSCDFCFAAFAMSLAFSAAASFISLAFSALYWPASAHHTLRN